MNGLLNLHNESSFLTKKGVGGGGGGETPPTKFRIYIIVPGML